MPQQISMVKYQDVNSKCTYDINLKLHQNHRIENKRIYQAAVKDALFGDKGLPYMPTEPPASLSEEIVESDPLYVCKQCKDCFRFQNSFEDHKKRRSWILGFWCRNCFITVCTHITKTGSACPACIKKDMNKRWYLRRRGLTKYQKLGVIKVFYNQCQFCEHVKMHDLSAIDMGDLMLMPLSANMYESDWSPEVEIICEALMERSLLSRIHIMDWLKIHNLENNWWKLDKSNNNMITKLVEGYKGQELFKTFEKSTINESINVSSSDNFNDKDANKIADKNVSENEDNPCMSTDITFVDCGPTSQHFEPESSVSYVPKRQITGITKSAHNSMKSLTDVIKINNKHKITTYKDLHSFKSDMTNENTTIVKSGSSNKNFVIRQSSKNCVQQCKKAKPFVKKIVNNINKPSNPASVIEADINKILDNPIKIVISDKKVLPKILPKTNSNHLKQSQTSNNSFEISEILPKSRLGYLEQNKKSKRYNSKILNIQSSRNVSNKILPKINSDHLEQDLQTSINNNSKILSIESPQNVDITSIIDQLPSHLISNKKLVVIGQDSNNVIACDKNEVSTEKRLNTLVLDNSNDANTNMSQKNCNFINIKKQDKFVIKDGKKYLIKYQNNIKDTENPSNLRPIMNSMTKVIKQQTSEHNTSVSVSTNSSQAENIDIEQVSFSNNISTPSITTDLCLTPSPSPSESSNYSDWTYESYVRKNSIKRLQIAPPQLIMMQSSSGTTQKKYLFETISLVKKNEDIYMNVKVVDRISKEGFRDTCEVIPKYREQMIDEFDDLDSFELKERINHLQLVNEEMRKVLNFLSSNVLWEKSRSINTLQHILEKCLQKCNQDMTDKKNDDVILDEWESEISETDSHKCLSCNKLMKPKSYIPGFSKLSKDDDIYCSCYKLVCHECLSYQDNLSRFTAHQNYHKNCEPYVCPDCHSKFDSIRSLEVHTWTVCFHTLKKFVLSCKICEIDGFRDMESITRHIAIMHSTTRIACEECGKILSSYSEYLKHSTETHPFLQNRKPVRLVGCKLGNVIVRFENFMWYTEMHPAIRKLIWFKCPFCSLTTLENKHTTAILSNHLRNKHLHRLSEILSKEALVDIFGKKFFKTDVNPISENFVNSFTNETAKQTIIPRIVNARTISSEVFEHGTEDEISLWKYDDSHVAWSSRLEMKPSTMKKNIDDEQEIKSLPKIVSVKSMSNLKPFKLKETVVKTSTNAKEKSNSQFSQAEIVIDDKDDPLASENAKEVKLNDSISDNKEETEKTKEPDKTNNESISINTHNVCINSSTQSRKRILDPEFMTKPSIDGRIKVVDIKKICKPNIEPFVTSEPKSTPVLGDENTSHITSTLQPSAKIPQHLFESEKVCKSDNGSKNFRKKKFLSRSANKTKRRIAIHGTTGMQEINIDYLCHLCGEQINTSRSIVEAHFREKHSHEYKLAIITPRLTRIAPDFINGGYKQFINSRKRKADSALLMSKRKRRWTSKKHTETKDASTPVGLCVEQETAEDGEGNFKCKKCDQRCTDMSNLREHIAANHRLKGRYVICLECGENFVVTPSLQMHLKAFHGIEDPINYMNQNPSYALGVDGDSEAEGKTTVANQCYVCMAVFEDKAAVDKHLRVHGMAFLNRRRVEARNALKTPEKKAHIEEGNIAKNSPKEMLKQDKPAEIILEKLDVAI
ncbi:Zinc finger protein 687 [Camponotus floridanus]|uniref:Zinc finger protein 687 n=1 Tax=Camponotus floridanus TaxID=104421 RepID=E2A613_CAMFO|nr:Zinc finger protein 687 [Camponotus floridanus]